MNKDFVLHIPINSVSYGFVSIAILRECFKRGLSPCVFPIGQPDLSSHKPDQDFNNWLTGCCNKAPRMHSRKNPVIRLWHINQILDSVSDRRLSIVFNETDQITDTEKNILEQQDVVFVTSNFTKEVFEDGGLKNVKYLPLAFDDWNFKETNIPKNSDVVVFTLNSKREVRKATDKIVSCWVKRFGNQRNYQLNLACFNPFFRHPDGRILNPDEQKAIFIQQVLGGKNVWNINFLPWMNTLAEINNLYNYTDVDLSGLSRCEGFNLPLFIHLCLGKHAVVLDAHVHKDWCNAENSILVQPNTKIKAVDGLFFHDGAPFLQGNWFDWDESEVIAAMEKAVEKVKNNRVNEAGKWLKQKYKWDQTFNMLLEEIR